MKTINHTNGYPVYSRLKKATKQSIEQRFIIPKNQPYLYVDENNIPFVQEPNSPKLRCTVKKSSLICGGFHSTI